ncbi:SGNH/GDSL hydrolase family protein [Lysobacter korlensis]|uniref:SGNH/GDSL hydrolase family protein n=1 Tax=Lysobacter korlensis TaxID=553636 RepID=A0ABV6RW96_9GAMM
MNVSFLRRNRLLAGLFTAVLATGIVAGTAAPASAGNSHHKKIDYVALGDSYAAGQGGGRYLDECLHTKAAYPRAVDKLPGVKLIADATCSGATSLDVLKHQIPRVKHKLQKAELVTLTVGANDIASQEIRETCGAPGAAAPATFDEQRCTTLVLKAIANVKERVLKALVKIDDIRDRVKILVTGYPRLFAAPADAFQARANAAVDGLNAALHQAVKKANMWGVRAYFVDVTRAFHGRLIGDRFPWLHAEGNDTWHPNKWGHLAYSVVVIWHVKRIF